MQRPRTKAQLRPASAWPFNSLSYGAYDHPDQRIIELIATTRFEPLQRQSKKVASLFQLNFGSVQNSSDRARRCSRIHHLPKNLVFVTCPTSREHAHLHIHLSTRRNGSCMGAGRRMPEPPHPRSLCVRPAQLSDYNSTLKMFPHLIYLIIKRLCRSPSGSHQWLAEWI